MGILGREDAGQGGSWWCHIYMWINWEGQLGSQIDHETQDFGKGKESFKTSGCKNLWGLQQWEELPASQGSCWRDLLGPRMYTNPPSWQLVPDQPNLLVGSSGSD